MKKLIPYLSFFLILSLAIFLRFYQLDSLTSPYWEEVALGYDAYSISQTGKDHHGHSWPIAAFESFGDWKPSGYFYTLVPFVKIFGLNVWAVRLPSAIAGIFFVIGIFVLVKAITPTHLLKMQPYLPHLAMLVAAISPWSILFSRAAWEVNLATTLILWGVNFFLLFMSKKNNLAFVFAVLLLGAAMYTYHAARVIAPLIGLGLVVTWIIIDNHSLNWQSSLKKFFTKNLGLILIGLLLSLAILGPFIFGDSQATSQRFKETSIFSDLQIIEESNQAKLSQNNILGKLFYHRYLLFGRQIVINYLSHFNVNFLFLSGDSNVRHSTQYIGQLYHIEIIFLFFGLTFCLSVFRKTEHNHYFLNYRPIWSLLIFWLLIGIVPASLTFATPHALRILPTLPIFIVLIAFGITHLIDSLPKKVASSFIAICTLIYLAEVGLFWRHYTTIYPQKNALAWQGGYEELIKNINPATNHNKLPVYISREQGRPAMYFWFYTQTPPQNVQNANLVAKKDQGEFLEFENYHFVNTLDEVAASGEVIIAGSMNQIETYTKNHQVKIEIIKSIYATNGEVVWQIAKKYE